MELTMFWNKKYHGMENVIDSANFQVGFCDTSGDFSIDNSPTSMAFWTVWGNQPRICVLKLQNKFESGYVTEWQMSPC